MILGIDEVGRGPWAGPLVVGAVVLGDDIASLTDSKKLSASRREALATAINKTASVGLGWVHADELDELGLGEALRVATIRAVEQISVPYTDIIIDGTINFLAATGKGAYVTTMAKADLLIPAVSAASIVAKVARDQFMKDQEERYPGYGFDRHVGYGTAAHREALDRLGPSPIHRYSFAPIAALTESQKRGKDAEDQVGAMLEKQGHRILERNWRTKYCEIDIITRKNETIYIVEVKYRRSAAYGGGAAAINAHKLDKLRLGAELYAARHSTPSPLRLMAAIVNGDDSIELLEVE
jgi:ribonuclease HII